MLTTLLPLRCSAVAVERVALAVVVVRCHMLVHRTPELDMLVVAASSLLGAIGPCRSWGRLLVAARVAGPREQLLVVNGSRTPGRLAHQSVSPVGHLRARQLYLVGLRPRDMSTAYPQGDRGCRLTFVGLHCQRRVCALMRRSAVASCHQR